MNKIASLILLLILASVGAIVSGFHRSWLNNYEAQTILRGFEPDVFNKYGSDVLRYFAPLPERDRALVTTYCKDIHAQILINVGTRELVDTSDKPGCQALIKGGWHPKWTIADGLEFIRDPANYRIR